LHTEQHQSQVQPRCAAAQGGGVTHAHGPRKIGLERIDLGPQRGDPIRVECVEKGLALLGANIGRGKENAVRQEGLRGRLWIS
jgi:hypothetical protein